MRTKGNCQWTRHIYLEEFCNLLLQKNYNNLVIVNFMNILSKYRIRLLELKLGHFTAVEA